MKTLYFECNMGAAGDMLTAALLELLPDPDDFVSRFNALGIKSVNMKREKAVKCGITGTHVSMLIDGVEETSHDHHEHEHEGDREHDHDHDHEHHHDHHHAHEHDHHDHDHVHEHHHHSSLHDIEHIVDRLKLSSKVKDDILAVYELIAQAESHVHGMPVTDIHFHEVGTMDAIADVTAFCMLINELAPDRIIASPIHTGSGHVHCAHGILPVPAPATEYLLQGIPSYSTATKGELCTPTGAALLKHFASSFGPRPVMNIDKTGYGCGKKDFEKANIVRAFLGSEDDRTDMIVELECNIDDMTGEEIGFACEELLNAGARDVFTIPVQMKKNRPGILLCVITTEAEKETLRDLIFKHTTTIGIRESIKSRYVLERESLTMHGSLGDYEVKKCHGYNVRRSKAEYESKAAIARENGISILDLRKL